MSTSSRVAWTVAGILALSSSGPVFAQTATGSIYGDADPGTVVTIKSAATGLTKNITVGADGKFAFTVLPPGTYSVTEAKSGASPGTTDVVVVPGQGSPVVLGAAIEEVVVSGARATQIDIHTAQVYTTFSSQQLEELPVPRDIVSFATLAPGATRGTGNSTYSALPSISGSGISENTYYINGFNVTNLYQNLSYAQLPFAAIGSEQVIAGGYGPEYGMATGGVISLQTKKGTNTWEVGGQATYDPNSLRATTGPKTYTPGTQFIPGGRAYHDYSLETNDQVRYDLWVGGPIIKDKLFIFAAAELNKQTSTTYPAVSGSSYDNDIVKPFTTVNINWIIDDRNSLDATFISNANSTTALTYSTRAGVPASGTFATRNTYIGADVRHTGGWLGLIKYTGNITDDLTLSAQYGQLFNKNEDYQVAANGVKSSFSFGQLGNIELPGCPVVSYNSTWITGHPGEATPNCGVGSLGLADGSDTRRAGRIDLSYKLALPLPVLATHTFSAGFDFDRWTSKAGSAYPGGARITYYDTECPYDIADCSLAKDGYTGDFVAETVFQTNAAGSVHSNSYYLKDDVQVLSNLLVQLGVRNDSFSNINGAGQTYLKQDDIWQPRLGLVWDVEGDAKSKLYASYGIYTNPVTAGVAVRGASASLFCYKYFKYTAIDPVTGRPTLGEPLATNDYCINGENGLTPPAGTFASTNLGPTKNQEIVVGFQRDLGSGWTAGIKGTYTNLQQTIDDICDFRGLYNWAADNGVGHAGLDDYVATYGAACQVINPGESASLAFDVDGSGKLTNALITPAELGLDAVKRRYVGVDVTLDKAWNGTWYASLTYTWSHQYGNTEGTANSDNSQADIGTTQNFDYPQIMEGSYGDLPNDHRHTFKAQGAYRFLHDFTATTNILVQTGKPINCIGWDPEANTADNPYGGGSYGAVYHFCNGQLSPRGTSGRTPTLFQLDLALNYAPSYAPGFSAQVSVFNVFNKRTAMTVNETGETAGATDPGSLGVPYPYYRTPLSYQPPRSVEFAVQYKFDWK